MYSQALIVQFGLWHFLRVSCLSVHMSSKIQDACTLMSPKTQSLAECSEGFALLSHDLVEHQEEKDSCPVGSSCM